MKKSPRPYALSAEMLLQGRTRGSLAAMVGEMVAVQAELDHLLGRTKARIDRASWVRYADSYREYIELYESACRRYLRVVDGDHGIDAQVGSAIGSAIRDALEGTRAVLEVVREAAARVGVHSWPD
ncbi:hypothetical protein [Micromonospora sp. NPDC050495]|uniref:hypothetical protein n=1 Tax=Micromonospora sp. NPDC050495 TaxID=3154936 RepID=UPI0034085605